MGKKVKKEGKKKKKHSQHARSFTPENTNKQVAHLEMALSLSFSCLFSIFTHRRRERMHSEMVMHDDCQMLFCVNEGGSKGEDEKGKGKKREINC